jgi:hypothetical protein
MHKVDADGNVAGMFVDQVLPGTPGTLDAAAWNNAVQQEIVQTIQFAGLTIEPDSATDEANGWHQLRDAIFSSEAIDTAAITDGAITDVKVNDMSVDKLTGGTSGTDAIDITDVSLNRNWRQTTGSIIYTDNNTGSVARLQNDAISVGIGSIKCTMENTNISFSGASNTVTLSNANLTVDGTLGTAIVSDNGINVNKDGTTYYESQVNDDRVATWREPSGGGVVELETRLSNQGVQYSGSEHPGDSAFRGAFVRQGVFSHTGTYANSVTTGAYNYTSTNVVFNGVPVSATVYSAYAYYVSVGGIDKLAPVRLSNFGDDGSGNLKAAAVEIIANEPSSFLPNTPTNAVKYFLIYDGIGV